MEVNEIAWSFIAEWFDPHPQLSRSFILTYHSYSNEIEMKDRTTNRKYLKRTKLPTKLLHSDFTIGSYIVIFSRNLKIVDYANSTTKELLDSANEKMTIVVMPFSYLAIGKIIRDIELKGFRLTNARSFCVMQSPAIVESLALAFPGEDNHAVEDDNEGIGAAISFQGKHSVFIINEMRSDLHYQYGSGIYFCRTSEEVETFENILFSAAVKTTATYDNCTCCVVKPHIIKAKTAGEIIDAIETKGYEISAMQIFHLDQASASEFFEVYNGVVNEFHAIVDEFTSGPALVLELRAEEAVSSFRKFAGPWDVNFAKELYPSTLRARFGKNRVENAVHCTDLETEGVSEVSYFFEILANR